MCSLLFGRSLFVARCTLFVVRSSSCNCYLLLVVVCWFLVVCRSFWVVAFPLVLRVCRLLLLYVVCCFLLLVCCFMFVACFFKEGYAPIDVRRWFVVRCCVLLMLVGCCLIVVFFVCWCLLVFVGWCLLCVGRCVCCAWRA